MIVNCGYFQILNGISVLEGHSTDDGSKEEQFYVAPDAQADVVPVARVVPVAIPASQDASQAALQKGISKLQANSELPGPLRGHNLLLEKCVALTCRGNNRRIRIRVFGRRHIDCFKLQFVFRYQRCRAKKHVAHLGCWIGNGKRNLVH